ncbi:hypothetical protein L1049_013400 [Liquidambar formosana]|uniref:Uncharacterized protein n=1 Tax=Liquidambar formosana TaxID=63359 RepID=A0AAP0RLU1_LIQFO
MEHVVCMFYWGGEIIQDPNEGITYNPNEATGLYDIPRQSTLSELVDMLVPIMAENRESVRLKLICRYPYSTPMGMKYKRLLINDNRTLKNVLDIPARYSSLDCVEVYVVKDTPLPDAPLRTLQQPGTVTHLLTQGSDTTAPRPQESHGTGLNTDSGHHTPVHTSLPSFGQCMPETINIEHTGGDSRSPMADPPVEAAADTTQAGTADTTQAAAPDTTQAATADTTQAVTADTTQAATDSSGQRGHAEHRRSHSPESVDLIYRRTKRVTRRPAYGT